MGISKITRNFQVTIPKDVRKIKDLNVGDDILFIIEDNKIDLVKMDKQVILDVAGLWSNIKETGLEYERKLRKPWTKRKVE